MDSCSLYQRISLFANESVTSILFLDRKIMTLFLEVMAGDIFDVISYDVISGFF